MNCLLNGLPLNSGDPFSKRHRRSQRRWPAMEPKHAFIAACFLATFVAYVERVGFSIAYTEMAKVAAVDEAVKGTVLSAFFWGYAVSQVPSPIPPFPIP